MSYILTALLLGFNDVLLAEGTKPADFGEAFAENAGTSLFIAFVVTLAIVIYFLANHKGTRVVTNKTYESPNAFDLISTKDQYLRTTVTKTRKSNSNRR